MAGKRPPYELAFVLGGGGVLGAHEVGMLQALAERGIRPDVVLGTSVGALNGAFFAADPTPEGVARLSRMWEDTNQSQALTATLLRRVTTLARTGTHLQSLSELKDRLERVLPVERWRICSWRFSASRRRSSEPPSTGSTRARWRT